MPLINMNKETQSFHWLDLLRFFAAFLVIIAHARGAFFVEFRLLPVAQQSTLNELLFALTRLGGEAVYCFFVISGFLVGGKAIIRIKENTFNIKDYAIDRTVRIILPLFPSLILIYLVNLIIGKPNDILRLVGNFLSLQGILVETASDPLWSLSIEVWFYITMGSIATFIVCKNKRIKIISFLILIICTIVFTKLPAVYAMIWFLSAFSFLLYPIKKNRLILILSFILLGILIICLQITSGSRSLSISNIALILPSKEILQILFSIVVIIFVLTIINFKPQKIYSQRINKIGTKLASFSYTLYLTHMPILQLLQYWKFPKSHIINIQSVLLYILEITICLISAWIIYYGFEKHTYLVKQIIKKKLSLFGFKMYLYS